MCRTFFPRTFFLGGGGGGDVVCAFVSSLPRLVRWLSTTSRILGSTPCGSEFRAGVENNPHPKAQV
jgi:hypothetical protein